MMSSRYRLAEIVVSTAGRDRGKKYLVIGRSNENHIKLADGDKKRLEHPKVKNIKHLRSTGTVLEEISIWLSEGKRVRNEDVKKAIKDYEKNEEAK